MKITFHQPDEEGMIHIKDCNGLLTMGLQEDVVTIWAGTGDKGGIDMRFAIKMDGDSITAEDYQSYITSFINDHLIVHLFGEKPPTKKVII